MSLTNALLIANLVRDWGIIPSGLKESPLSECPTGSSWDGCEMCREKRKMPFYEI